MESRLRPFAMTGDLVELYNEGHNLAELAYQFKHTRDTVKGILRHRGIHIRTGVEQQRWMSEEDQLELVRLYDDGVGVKKLSVFYHRGYKIIQHILEARRVQMRTGREQAEIEWTVQMIPTSLREVNPQCRYCGLRLDLVSTIHDLEQGRCCDFCYHHVNHLERHKQGDWFWSAKGLEERYKRRCT